MFLLNLSLRQALSLFAGFAVPQPIEGVIFGDLIRARGLE
jgi:hypothetical protein